MRKLSALALVTVALWGGDARAVEVKNVRFSYGPFGAERSSNKLLAGDVIQINFDILGLTIDPKSGLTKYTKSLQINDPKGKEIFSNTEKVGLFLSLGGNSVPEIANVAFGVDLMPGKYTAKVTVTDATTKMSKTLVQELELLPPGFGIIHVEAMAMGFKGQDYAVQFALAGMGRDKKNFPKVTVSVRVLDEAGSPTLAEAIISRIPDDLPSIKADKQELFRVGSPIYLNRPGRFTVVIEAVDEITGKKTKLSYPLTVLDPAGK